MIKNKIKKLKDLKNIVNTFKEKGKKVVFSNGCFDILHLGHIKYLEKASSLGDKLIVAINSDASVRKIKGKMRPVFSERERANLVAALEYVDYVIIFSETTPFKLIKFLRPDILVKGGNWRKKEIVGKKFVESYGGKVVCADFIKGYSSSSIIEKIKRMK